MARVLSYDPTQHRVDDAPETVGRPNVSARRDVMGAAAAAVQWDEDTHGPFPFRHASKWLGTAPVLRIGNAEVTTGASEKPEGAKDWTYTVLQAAKASWRPIVSLQRPIAPSRRFDVLQQWEGTVLKVFGTEFSASLRDLTGQLLEEQATFDIDEVSEGDRDLLAPGAVFYWALGYETSEAGQVSRVSRIRFRRLPWWTKRDLARLEERAARLEALFGSSR